MPRRAVLLDTSLAIWLLLLAALATLARGLPAPQEDNSSGPLPFIQFTKGGIRVNFGGYHAQAGLGGLLTGSKADGGLHASAGTPDGAHASAGLGGSLDGGPVGGLQARAGLGNGGPEAEAGLGGTLAGPQPQGMLYANSSPGAYAVPDSVNNIDRAERRRQKNVQAIARTKKSAEQVAAPAFASVSANADKNIKEASPSQSSTSSSSSSPSASSGTTVNAGSTIDDDEAEKSEHPARWYFKKRVRERAGPHLNKTSHIVIGSAAAQPPQQDAAAPSPPPTRQSPVNLLRQGIFARAAAGADSGADVSVTATKYKSSTLFDDIFNIPISALNAVNQLLRNHVGKK